MRRLSDMMQNMGAYSMTSKPFCK